MDGLGGKGEGEVDEGRDEQRGKGNAGKDSWGRGWYVHIMFRIT